MTTINGFEQRKAAPWRVRFVQSKKYSDTECDSRSVALALFLRSSKRIRPGQRIELWPPGATAPVLASTGALSTPGAVDARERLLARYGRPGMVFDSDFINSAIDGGE